MKEQTHKSSHSNQKSHYSTHNNESQLFFDSSSSFFSQDIAQKKEAPFFEKTPSNPFFQPIKSPSHIPLIQKQRIEDEEVQRKEVPIQKKASPELSRRENKTGLPDNLKTGIENHSGYSMDDVKVHRNSDKPAALQAHAYAQGTHIHLASGQEKHLPHEAWHVVQQKQGRVKPTLQMKGKVNVNDDAGLEKEADVMGAKALSQSSKEQGGNEIIKESNHNVTQLKIWKGKLGADASLYRENGKQSNLPAKIKQGSDLEHDDTKEPPKNKKHANFPNASMTNGYDISANTEGYVLAYKVILVDEDQMLNGGVGKSVMNAWGSDEDYLSEMNAAVAACEYIDEYIEAATSSEQDVGKWRKRAIGLGAANAVAGGTMLGLGIAAIVASGGTLLIPLAIAGGAVAATGIGSGVSKAGMNQSLKGGGHSKKQAAALETGKAAVIPGAKEAALEGVKAASGEAAKATAGAIAAPVGGAFTASMAMNDVRKAVKVNPKDVWKSLDWEKIKSILEADKSRLEKERDVNQSLSRQFELTITKIETTLGNIKN